MCMATKIQRRFRIYTLRKQIKGKIDLQNQENSTSNLGPIQKSRNGSLHQTVKSDEASLDDKMIR